MGIARPDLSPIDTEVLELSTKERRLCFVLLVVFTAEENNFRNNFRNKGKTRKAKRNNANATCDINKLYRTLCRLQQWSKNNFSH